MIEVIQVALHSGDELEGREALEVLIEIADEHPKFLKGQLSNLVLLLLSIGNETSLDVSTRSLSCEFLVRLCSHSAGKYYLKMFFIYIIIESPNIIIIKSSKI